MKNLPTQAPSVQRAASSASINNGVAPSGLACTICQTGCNLLSGTAKEICLTGCSLTVC